MAAVVPVMLRAMTLGVAWRYLANAICVARFVCPLAVAAG